MNYRSIPLLLALAFNAANLFAQGIVFKTDANLAEIKQQAKRENKYIFIDVGATFCAPCHMMEREVFTKDSVGAFYNKNFINIKLQANKTSNDDEQVKSWYADAAQLLKQYDVTAYPTYLFLSPQGELIYRYAGAPPSDQFISIGKAALDPKLNIKAEILAFDDHKMNLAEEGRFALFLLEQGYKNDADRVAKNYLSNYLNKADEAILKETGNLRFISRFQFFLTPEDKYFKLFYNEPKEMDSLVKYPRPGYSYRLTNRIIVMHAVWDRLYEADNKSIKNPQPDWKKISSELSHKYDSERIARILPIEKYRFYVKAKNWPQVAEYAAKLIDDTRYNSSAEYDEMLNQAAFYIFLYSENHHQLKSALNWTWKKTQQSPDNFTIRNTYSCLSYKSGNVKDAIQQAQLSVELLDKNGEHEDKDDLLPAYKDNLQKMKQRADFKTFSKTIEGIIPL